MLQLKRPCSIPSWTDLFIYIRYKITIKYYKKETETSNREYKQCENVYEYVINGVDVES